MLDIDEQKKIAILIDADNTPYDKIPAILQEIAVHGHIITKRAYGDFSIATLKHWKDVLNENAIIPVQQFSYTKGKNSSDSAMIIDAMDLLYTEKYDAFVLVSSDSDFTKIASRLRESQEFVFGVGKKQTPVPFVNACDDFIYIENLKDVSEAERTQVKHKRHIVSSPQAGKQEGKGAPETEMPSAGDAVSDEQYGEIYTLLMAVYERCAAEDGWAFVSTAGSLLKRISPGFDTRNYGFRKLSDLIKGMKDDFEMKGASDGRRTQQLMYRPIK